MMRRISLFIAAYILWVLLTWPTSPQHLIIGVAVAALSSAIFGNIFAEEPRKLFQLNRWFWFLWYIPFFLWECFKANIDVAYRVLHPMMPINPGIVKVKTTLTTEMGKTMLANSITMTPGTMSVDIVGEHLYIHWINVRSKDIEEATHFIVDRFEKHIKRICE